MLSSSLVNVASVATSAMLSGFASTCFSKRLWMNGVSTGLKVGISFEVSNSTSLIHNSLMSFSINWVKTSCMDLINVLMYLSLYNSSLYMIMKSILSSVTSISKLILYSVTANSSETNSLSSQRFPLIIRGPES